jgi:hypothetical protein
MRVFTLVVLALTLGGCWIQGREPVGVTQLELEAVNARNECKRIARTLVQISRCDSR